ncbi:hypothetical protein ISF_00142 [Cordyceps fumosorosea ARSEF 2679]|uniref:Uncharacterized protein n=1 Tax=Cordyceps fumosorosea (strain ARSEF 2679) TaxID=1081104 RepID=A0A168E0U5_CORFA|nr:hypothetical protein ISF_00142 [Cordyceps fumosorosea ARSEF 2679]OAA73241.1 hypothetical protein ISF_00142 [Cordyceps fumosorosea ARSEF 2679]
MADVEPCVRAIPENPCPQIHSDPAQNHDQNHDPFMAIIGAPATIGATFWDLQAITTLVETVNGPVEMPIETPNLGVGTASAELEDVVDESDVLGNEPFNMEVGAEDEEDAEDDNGEEAFAEPFVEPWEYDLAEDFLVGPVDDQETTTDDANSSSPGSPFLPPGGVWTAVALATGAGSNELDTPGVGSEVPEQQANNGTGNQALMTGSQDSPSWGSQQAPSWAFYNSAYNSAYRDVGASNLNWHETGRHLGTLGSTSRGYHLVRAYEKDLEMRALEDMDVGGQREIGIYCPNTLTFGYPLTCDYWVTDGQGAPRHANASSKSAERRAWILEARDAG